MYKYNIEIEEKPNAPYNPLHEIVEGRQGVILEAEIGTQGWFAYKIEEPEEVLANWSPWHRVHTSDIKNITESNDKIELETENTFYIFKKCL